MKAQLVGELRNLLERKVGVGEDGCKPSRLGLCPVTKALPTSGTSGWSTGRYRMSRKSHKECNEAAQQTLISEHLYARPCRPAQVACALPICWTT